MGELIGQQMYQWATQLFPLNRSLTGKGVRMTLEFIKKELPELQIHEVPSGTQAFDWTVPKEWSMNAGYIADLSGTRLIDFENNNLHVVGYSTPIDKVVTKD